MIEREARGHAPPVSAGAAQWAARGRRLVELASTLAASKQDCCLVAARADQRHCLSDAIERARSLDKGRQAIGSALISSPSRRLARKFILRTILIGLDWIELN